MGKITKKTLYPLIPILIFGISAFFVVKSIEFVAREVNTMFSIDKERIERNIVEVDLENFMSVSDRLEAVQVQEVVEEEFEEDPSPEEEVE